MLTHHLIKTGAEVTVVDNGGNTIVSVLSGVAQYIYLVNNSTVNGVWESITFGAGTSAANAATDPGAQLAGAPWRLPCS